MSIQVNSWVYDYIEQLFVNRGYDPGDEEVEKVINAQQDNWNRFMVQKGLNKDEVLARDVAYEFSQKKLVTGAAKIFEQFAEFVASRPRAISDNETKNQNDLQHEGFEKCEVCEGKGAVSVPVFEEGMGPIYLENLNDAKLYVLKGFVRLESYDLEQRIDEAMMHPMVRGNGNRYFETRVRYSLTREVAHAFLVETCGYMSDRSRPTRYRVVERSHSCSCISGLKFSSVPKLSPTQEQFVRERVQQAGARLQKWNQDRGISTVSDDEYKRTWRAWFEREKAKGSMFRKVTDEVAGDFLEGKVNHKMNLDSARQLTAALRQREVLTHDIPDGWEAVIYANGTFTPCDVKGGFIQPHPQARVQKIRFSA